MESHSRNPRIPFDITTCDASSDVTVEELQHKSHVIVSLMQDYRQGTRTSNSMLLAIGFCVYKVIRHLPFWGEIHSKIVGNLLWFSLSADIHMLPLISLGVFGFRIGFFSGTRALHGVASGWRSCAENELLCFKQTTFFHFAVQTSSLRQKRQALPVEADTAGGCDVRGRITWDLHQTRSGSRKLHSGSIHLLLRTNRRIPRQNVRRKVPQATQSSLVSSHAEKTHLSIDWSSVHFSNQKPNQISTKSDGIYSCIRSIGSHAMQVMHLNVHQVDEIFVSFFIFSAIS